MSDTLGQRGEQFRAALEAWRSSVQEHERATEARRLAFREFLVARARLEAAALGREAIVDSTAVDFMVKDFAPIYGEKV